MLVLTALAGCVRPEPAFLTPPRPELVWPKPPDRPRIRYLGELRSSDDVGARPRGADLWERIVYGPTEPARLVSPHAVALNAEAGRIAVADTNAACVHVFDLQRHSYERKQRCGVASDELRCPVAVAWVGETLWVADSQLHAIAVFEPGGAGRLVGQELLDRPAGLAFCPANQLCYVTDAGAHAVLAFDATGRLALRFGSHGGGPGQFNHPSHISCGPGETLAVADSLAFRIQRFALDGSPLGSFGGKGDAAGDFALPKGVAAGPDGNLWVVDAHFENVQGFTPDGRLLMAFGREGQGPGEFWLPSGICIDAKRRMWVADTYNRRVQVFELIR